MKKVIIFLLIASSLQSCATILSGKTDACQTTKPLPGQAKRAVRPGYLVADIFLTYGISLAIDFYTGAIYRPCDKMNVPVKK